MAVNVFHTFLNMEQESFDAGFNDDSIRADNCDKRNVCLIQLQCPLKQTLFAVRP